jgi:tRNA (cytidine/uridine-2'-O-)-methyltransferase
MAERPHKLSEQTGKSIAVALYEPEIPLNVGSIARTCACTGVPLHLVGRLGFRVDDREAKRAGLDYWEHVESHVHRTWDEFVADMNGRNMWFFSTKGEIHYHEIRYQTGDVLVFGSEGKGLPDELLKEHSNNVLTIPMIDGRRSLNLSNAVAVVTYRVLTCLHEFK